MTKSYTSWKRPSGWIPTAAIAMWLAVILPTGGHAAEYAIVVSNKTFADAAWKKVVVALEEKYQDHCLIRVDQPEDGLETLRKHFPRYTCFVATPEEATRDFVAKVHQVTRKIDDDIYTDTLWGILTGYNAANALAIARHKQPLVVKKVASGTEFATEMVTEGQWYDELVKNKHVKKAAGGKAKQLKGPDDTTKPLVDLLNSYQPDLMITSGHATERDWQLGFRFRSGYFRCADGELYGLDTKSTRQPIASPNPKVYMPIGNCLMGHVNDRDAMALAWMNSAGVMQMLGYTIPTGYGYGGWGCLDYFVEQPGRYTFTEAFMANHHALVQRMNDPGTDRRTQQRLRGDLDVVAFYGDPKWSAKMAEMPKFYDQKLDIKDGTYSLTITPKRGEGSFKPVNMNGSERGGRPIIQFLTHRIKDVEIVAGAELKPVVTDDFILVPNPRICDPERDYKVSFTALKR